MVPRDFRLLFIVLISSIYGMNQGIVAAALGAAALVFSFSQNGTDCFTLFYEPVNWIPFIAYFIVGAICGYVHLKRRDDLLFLRKENERVREKFSFLRGLYCDTVDICKAYKKQILGRRDSFGKVYEIANRLNVAYPKELCTAIIQVLEELLENRTICVYSVEKKQDLARLKAASKGAFQRVPHRIRTSDCRDIMKRLKVGEVWKNTTFRKTYPMYMAGIRRDSELIWIVSVQEVKASQMSFYDMNRIKVICGLVENQLNLRAYVEVSQTLAMMERLWPEREQYWMLQMQYYIVQKQGAQLKKLLEKMEKKHIYLSAAGREAVAFWKNDSQEGK